MAIAKRVRYEVMRRDGHACRYCGGKAPDVELTIDHVMPVSLGGTNDPGNLVAACRDCNAGKTSAAPDAAMVQDVAEDALRWSRAMKMAAAEAETRRGEIQRVARAVRDEWGTWVNWRGQPAEPPLNYEESIEQWLRAGLTLEEMLALIPSAQGRREVTDRWRYFAGCCWSRVRQLQDRARQILDEQQAAEPALDTVTP